jgi:hypothetical protein
MKLKNFMDHHTKKDAKRSKQPKFADIGINLLSKKKNLQPSTGIQHQNSELIELNNNMSGIGKGIIFLINFYRKCSWEYQYLYNQIHNELWKTQKVVQ